MAEQMGADIQTLKEGKIRDHSTNPSVKESPKDLASSFCCVLR